MDIWKNDEFCIETDEFCINDGGFCINNAGFCIENAGFCIKNDGFNANGQVRVQGSHTLSGIDLVRAFQEGTIGGTYSEEHIYIIKYLFSTISTWFTGLNYAYLFPGVGTNKRPLPLYWCPGHSMLNDRLLPVVLEMMNFALNWRTLH